MGNGINKVFVNLGVALIILGLVATGMQIRGVKLPFVDKEFKEATQEMRKESVASHDNSDFEVASSDDVTSDETHSKTSSRTSSSTEDKWVKTGTRVCTIAWNNKDFKDGWCKIGNPTPGEYRFKVRSSLQGVSHNGVIQRYDATGSPINRYNSSSEYVDFMNTYSPVQNGLIGKVIFKVGDEGAVDDWDISVNQKNSLYASINTPLSQESWETHAFSGKITIDIFKKKS